jgi:hypothetical protein
MPLIFEVTDTDNVTLGCFTTMEHAKESCRRSYKNAKFDETEEQCVVTYTHPSGTTAQVVILQHTLHDSPITI